MQICDFIKDFAKINAEHILLVMFNLTLEIQFRNNRIDFQNKNKTQKIVENRFVKSKVGKKYKRNSICQLGFPLRFPISVRLISTLQ
jgi:uncharacterized membrane protein